MLNRILALNRIGLCCKHAELVKKNLPKLLTISVRNYVTSEDKNEVPSDESVLQKNRNPFTDEAVGMVQQIKESSQNDHERRLKVLKLEVDISHQEGRRVPALDFFEDHHWEHVLGLESKSARIKYYAYLWQIERKQESRAIKKQHKAEYGIKRKEEIKRENEENKHIIYGLSHTSMFLRIYDSAINHWQNNRLTRAMQFGQKIVLDCSYDEHMNSRESINAAKQLLLCFSENRANDDPFDIHFCNVNLKSQCMRSLQRFIPTMLNPEFPMNVHEKCFTEMFPKKNLVYLTPHCRTDLQVYNPDDVYIIGAMVDKTNNEPLSLAKAKKLNLRMARLPLDQYLQWGSGSGKSLTLNQMVNIMLDLKKTGDWNKALVHVPRRKLVDERLEMERSRGFVHKRAIQLSMGPDSRSQLKENTNVRSRKGNPFSVENWARPKTKIEQN